MTPAEHVADQLAVTDAAVEPTTPQAVHDLLTAPKPAAPGGRMTGPEHYTEAERLYACAVSHEADLILRKAQLHALLALAAATALGAQTSTPGPVYQEWHNAAGPTAAKQVAS